MNHTSQTILGTLVVIGFVMGALFLYERSVRNQAEEDTSAVPEVPVNETPKESIEEYVAKNISTLSAEPEQLGGTFYVTNIEAADGSGIVSYEDGHNAYTADFTYSIDASGNPSIDSFVIRPQ
ncbi:MAG: hypothetical protein QG636_411 [Patescibacteria group bacterium]|jgi:hypothetical protein|nr:hypothetical protein [Patescibacteria group bacterium]